jgi:hypothetical protein
VATGPKRLYLKLVLMKPEFPTYYSLFAIKFVLPQSEYQIKSNDITSEFLRQNLQ